MSWSTAQQLRINSTRLRPALDLLKRSAEMIGDPSKVKSVLDLGCGPGNVTPFLCSAFPLARIHGVDKNIETVQKAKTINDKADFKDRVSYATYSIENIAEMTEQRYDLIFCNSALHWCQRHDQIIPKLIKNVLAENGGVLAIQMPDTRIQPSHLLMETAALRTGLGDHLREVRIPRVERDPDWYFDHVAPQVKEIDMWCTDYMQQLETTYEQQMATDFHPVLEYSKGAGLLNVINALGGESSEKCHKFLREYNRLLYDQYPTVCVKNHYHLQGKLVTLLPFKRFFLLCRT